MTLYTTLEIDETDTDVKVEFTSEFGEIVIEEINDDLGNDIYLDSKNMATLFDECHEYAANNEFIPLENN